MLRSTNVEKRKSGLRRGIYICIHQHLVCMREKLVVIPIVYVDKGSIIPAALVNASKPAH